MAVLASLPPQQTVVQFLTGCWRRLNNVKNELTMKNVRHGCGVPIYFDLDSQSQKYAQQDVNNALPKLEELRMLLMSYIGLTMQDPEMFPQPRGYISFLSKLILISDLALS